MSRYAPWFLGLALVAGGGCATSFTGSAYVENGRAGCEQMCSGQGMVVAGMVFMGEYSSACVCEVPGQRTGVAAAAAPAGGAVGTMTQMQEAQRSASR